MKTFDPYAPPSAFVTDVNRDQASLEAKRRQYIRHEILLKSVGSLYAFGFVFMFLAMIAILIPSFIAPTKAPIKGAEVIGSVLIVLLFSGVLFFMAFGYRTLKPWVKIPGTILSTIGLLGIPFGTLINGYILYLIWCEKGQMVLSESYQAVIRATPHIKYVRSTGDKIAIGFLILLIVALAAFILKLTIGR